MEPCCIHSRRRDCHRNWIVPAYRPDTEFNLASDDPLGKRITVRPRPVSIFMNKWIDLRRRFNFFDDRASVFTDPLLNDSRWPIANALIWSQKVLVKMPPAGFVLVSVLPHFPSITSMRMAAFSCMKHQQPVVVSNDSGNTGNLCCTKLDLDHFLPYNRNSFSRCCC